MSTAPIFEQADELMKLFVPILRADLAMIETYDYAPEEELNCPLTAFLGSEDHTVGLEDIEAWHEQIRSAFALRLFPGNLFCLNSARALVLEAVTQDLVKHIQFNSASSNRAGHDPGR